MRPLLFPAQFRHTAQKATETRCRAPTRRLVSAHRLTATQSAGDRVAAAGGSLRHVAFRERSSSPGDSALVVSGVKNMARRFTLLDFKLRDILVLRDLVRFGVLANDQIERRYNDSSLAAARLEWLVEAGLVEPWSPLIEHTAVYSATAARRRRRTLRPPPDQAVTPASAPRRRRRRPGRLHPGATSRKPTSEPSAKLPACCAEGAHAP